MTLEKFLRMSRGDYILSIYYEDQAFDRSRDYLDPPSKKQRKDYFPEQVRICDDVYISDRPYDFGPWGMKIPGWDHVKFCQVYRYRIEKSWLTESGSEPEPMQKIILFITNPHRARRSSRDRAWIKQWINVLDKLVPDGVDDPLPDLLR